MPTVRELFDDRLNHIRSEVVHMGNLVAEMTRMASHAALTGSEEEALKVTAMDDEVDRIESATVRDVCVLMVQESPVASDLRLLTATLGVIGDIERAADHAVKLAKRSLKVSHGFPAELKTEFAELDRMARQLFALSIKLYMDYSPETVAKMQAIEDTIDKSYRSARRDLLTRVRTDPDDTELLVRVIRIFHALEHIGDHAISISRRLAMHYGAPRS
jgi:phosphate transport system protein